MRSVLQRVSYAKVIVDGVIKGEIQKGIVSLIAVNSTDDDAVFKYMFDKIVNLRIFEDDNERMNLSLNDLKGGLLIVPNFTLYADARKGRRPSFVNGAKPDEAEVLFNKFVEFSKNNYENVQTGIFKADMKIELINDGPVTIILDSDRNF